jgi:soluble lytic murein transglycosylase-like protein
VITAESAYDPEAISRTGAIGLMQLMPGTARRYGVANRRNPEDNISGGARYLVDLLKMFNNNLQLALAAYNAGENAVKEYGNKIPPYKETQNYVRKVLEYYNQYKKQIPS